MKTKQLICITINDINYRHSYEYEVAMLSNKVSLGFINLSIWMNNSNNEVHIPYLMKSQAEWLIDDERKQSIWWGGGSIYYEALEELANKLLIPTVKYVESDTGHEAIAFGPDEEEKILKLEELYKELHEEGKKYRLEELNSMGNFPNALDDIFGLTENEY